jgi:hypothetical protein
MDELASVVTLNDLATNEGVNPLLQACFFWVPYIVGIICLVRQSIANQVFHKLINDSEIFY